MREVDRIAEAQQGLERSGIVKGMQGKEATGRGKAMLGVRCVGNAKIGTDCDGGALKCTESRRRCCDRIRRGFAKHGQERPWISEAATARRW